MMREALNGECRPRLSYGVLWKESKSRKELHHAEPVVSRGFLHDSTSMPITHSFSLSDPPLRLDLEPCGGDEVTRVKKQLHKWS